MSALGNILVRRECRPAFFLGVQTLARASICILFAMAAAGPASAQELHKTPPASGSRSYDKQLTALIEERYPELTASKPAAIPVVTVLLNYDGSVAGTYLEFARGGTQALSASEDKFARFGVPAGRMQYIGVGRLQLPTTEAIVIFGAADSRDLDRELVERFFPDALTQHVPANEQLWILFDHEGHILRVGEDAVPAEGLRQTLEVRFRGLRTADMTTSPVFGRDGRPLEDLGHHALVLDCVWLTADSPLPDLKASN